MQKGSGDTIEQSYKCFCHDYVIPDNLTFYREISQIGKNTLFMKTINRHGMRYHVSSTRRANINPAEGAICEIKKEMV